MTTTETICPGCNKVNELADDIGCVDGPREWHADCWHAGGWDKSQTKTVETAIWMAEDILKAGHSMQFAVGNLQDALRKANAVEGLLLLDLIGTAVELQRKIEAMQSAVDLDRE